MILKLPIIDLIKWAMLVASAGMSVGVAKKNGMDFIETINAVDDQNKIILEGQVVILEEQAQARKEREDLGVIIREMSRTSKTTKGQIKQLGRNYAYLTHKLDPLEK